MTSVYSYKPQFLKKGDIMGSVAIPSGGKILEPALIISPQTKSSSPYLVSGHKTYWVCARASTVSNINNTTVSVSSGTVSTIFKSTSLLSSVNAYRIFEIKTNVVSDITVTVTGNATEIMIIGF